jgi:hypothetical protein
MNRIRARLSESGKSVIILAFMVMNLSKLAEAFLHRFLRIRYFMPDFATSVAKS